MNLTNPSSSNQEAKKVKGLDYLILGAIALIFFLCPLFFTGLTAEGIGFEKMMVFYFLALLGTVAWVTKGIITGELEFKRTPLDLPIAAMLIISVIATILSVNYRDSLLGAYGGSAKSLAALIIFILFYYLIVNNIDAKKIKFIFWSLVFSGSLIIVYSLLQLNSIFLLPLDFTKTTGFNPLGSLSGLTMFAIAVLPLLAAGMAQIKEIHPGLKNKVFLYFIKIVLGIIIAGDLAVLALLNGFTFWPAAIVSAVILLMFLLSKIIKISSGNLTVPIAVFLLLIIFLVLGNFNFLPLNLPAEVSLSRSASWEIAKAGLKENPFLGSGPATFYYSFGKFKNADFNNSPLWNARFDSASGGLFETIAGVGALGAVAAMVIMLIALSICFIALIKTKEDEASPILLGLFASFASIIILAFLFTLNNSLILIFILMSCLTVASAVHVYPEKFKTVGLSFRASAKYALALATIFLSVSAAVVILFTLGLKMYLADIYAKQSLTAGDASQKIEKLNRAAQLAPYRDNYYMSLANHYMTLANQEASNRGDQTIIQNNLSLAIENGKRAVELAPNKSIANESLALIYENASFYVRGALEWSENFYNKLAELEPNSPIPHLRIALINMARANAETDDKEKNYYINEAIKKFDEAIRKKSDLAAAYYGKAIAYEKLNQLDSAIDQMKRTVILSRDNIDYHFELGRLYFNRGIVPSNLSQTAAQDIAVNDASPEGAEGEGLTVQPSQPASGTISRNEDLNLSEQIFLNILQVMPNHANALYSLALLYQKTGERSNAAGMVERLLEVLPDDAAKAAVKEQFKGLY